MFRHITRNPKWWVFTATTLSLAMVMADQSALPVALPSIQRELHTSQDALQWVVNAYLLSLAVLVILGGKLGDKWGHRRAFLGGMTLFILSSIACAMAPSVTWLIISRVVQGVGAAFMLPAGTPLFRSTVPGNEFGKMAGLYVSGASVFLVLGPSVGGLLVQYLSWRWIFWINFPLALLGILIALFVVPKDVVRTNAGETFDWWGFASFTIAIVSLVFALMQGGILGWSSYVILFCVALCLVSGVIFFWIERRQTYPFLELSLFKNTTFSRTLFVLSLMQGLFVCIIFWAIFLQVVLGLSAGKTGLILLSAQVPVLLCSYIAGRFLDRYGPRLPISLGTMLVVIGSVWIAFFVGQNSVWWLLPGFIIFGIGIPFITLCCITTIISSAPYAKGGIASAIANGIRQVSGSIGLAVIGSVISALSNYRFIHWMTQHNLKISTSNIGHLDTVLAGTTNLQIAGLSEEAVHRAAAHAYMSAFSTAMYVIAVLTVLAFFVARKLPAKSLVIDRG
ncbi:MAG TPA: MFS transporter [Gammaproteobacteria bacterium]|nr:MFS transporter [Gammaproteobacteria bacterium]